MRRGEQQQRHAGQHHVSRQAVGFRHHAVQPLAVVLHAAEHRQKGGVENRRQRSHAHFAPFVGLGVAAQLGEVVERAYNERIDVLRGYVEQVAGHHAGSNFEDRLQRTKAELHRRAPVRAAPQDDAFDGSQRHRLPYHCPGAVAVHGKPDANAAANHQPNDVAQRHQSHVHLLDEAVGLHQCRAVKNEGEEHHAAERNQASIGAKQLVDKRSGKPQDGVERDAHAQVEPKHGAVVERGGLFALYERVREAAVDKQRCKRLKHQNCAHQSKVLLRDYVGKHNAGDSIQHLLGKFVDAVPLERACRLQLQRRLLVGVGCVGVGHVNNFVFAVVL